MNKQSLKFLTMKNLPAMDKQIVKIKIQLLRLVYPQMTGFYDFVKIRNRFIHRWAYINIQKI